MNAETVGVFPGGVGVSTSRAEVCKGAPESG